MTYLTLDRARAILNHAEDELAAGSYIEDVFTSFARGGAASRSEARHVMHIGIADFYRTASRRGQASTAMREFEQYIQGAGFIAMRLVADAAESPEALDALMRSSQHETIASFVQFLKTLDASDSEYFKRVYGRIGIEYLESSVASLDRSASPPHKPWWRFW